MNGRITTGYQTDTGAYYLVIQEGEDVSIKQILFNSAIYPAPVKEVEKKMVQKLIRLLGINLGINKK